MGFSLAGLAALGPRQKAILAALGFALLSIPATWPLVPCFSSGIVGGGDPWLWLWGFWWWREALVSLHRLPFFTDRLFWPEGLPLWFQSFDIPSAILAVPLWGLLPEVSIYNLMLWLTYPAAGLAFYFLCVELWEDRLAAFLAGCLYTFSAFHFAEGSAHLHLASIEWSPLYFLGLVRMLRGGSIRDAALAAAGLALGTLATPYHLLFCFVGTSVLFAARLADASERRTLLSGGFLRLACAMAAMYLALAGWFLAGMLCSGLADPIVVPHRPELLSADVVNFFVPNPTSAFAPWFSGLAARWTCRGAEAQAYVGYVAAALAAAGALRSRAARAYLAAAAAGAVLSLGPWLHVAGTAYRGIPLPYAGLARLMPGLSISGCPNKFSWLVTFGVCVAAGAALSGLCRRSGRGRVAACVVAALAVVECWPRPLPLLVYADPPFLRALAREPQDFAVLDVSEPLRALWHGILHRHPQPGGYVSRPPARSLEAIEREPILRALKGVWPAGARPEVVARRVDGAVALRGPRPAGPTVSDDWSQVQWEGSLKELRGGSYRFFIDADDYAALWIDGRPVAGGPGDRVREADVELAPGAHFVRFLYHRSGPSPRVRLEWRAPGETRGLLGAGSLRAPDGKPGLLAVYVRFVPDLGMAASAARRALRDLRIRYVITDGWRRGQVLALGLPRVYAGSGIEVYEVPRRE